MINKADILERLATLMGKELTDESLHEALFCEEKHKKILRRFHTGTHTYVTYKIITKIDALPYARITIPGNPHPFTVSLKEKDGVYIIHSQPKISYSYYN
ncbi:MAG: hypothetical protein LRY73_09295 [Bacillus sp. (in: Bacteria)]|nr:hypothetical protein [Bacillus sp. (in: firmicutes)]